MSRIYPACPGPALRTKSFPFTCGILNPHIRFLGPCHGSLSTPESTSRTRGATTFSKLGVQFLGLGYCAEHNTDGIPSFMHCSLLRNGNHTPSKKLGWSIQFFSGVPLPSGCTLVPNGITMGSAVFAGFTVVTDHATPSTAIGRV